MSFKSKTTQQEPSYAELDDSIFDSIAPAGSEPTTNTQRFAVPAEESPMKPQSVEQSRELDPSEEAVELSPFALPGRQERAPVVHVNREGQSAPDAIQDVDSKSHAKASLGGEISNARSSTVQESVSAAEPGFMTHYKTLRQVAQSLREQQEPDLDALIPLVDQALAAYKGCKSRIDQVNALLNERLDQVDGAH